MMAKNDGDWFAPKQFGIGTGLPIAWQGWLTMAVYTGIVLGTAFTLMPRHPVPSVAIIAVATVVFAVLSAQHTRGGWKWRWGND